MANAKDLKVNSKTNTLLIGDTGAGKTPFIASIPGNFIFDLDGGMLSAAGMDVEYETFRDVPLGASRSNAAEGTYPYGMGWTTLQKRINEIGRLIDKGEWNMPNGALRPISFDSLTSLGNIAMNYVLKSVGHIGNPQIQHYQSQMALIETLVEQITAWPCSIFVTAHIHRDTNKLTQSTEFLPLITGKLAGRLPSYFNEVYFVSVTGMGSTKKTQIRTETDALYKQSRSHRRLPNNIELTWANLEPYYKGLK